MESSSFQLFAGKIKSHHSSFEAAKQEALKYNSIEPYLRIVEIIGSTEGDWWAYDHESKTWQIS